MLQRVKTFVLSHLRLVLICGGIVLLGGAALGYHLVRTMSNHAGESVTRGAGGQRSGNGSGSQKAGNGAAQSDPNKTDTSPSAAGNSSSSGNGAGSSASTGSGSGTGGTSGGGQSGSSGGGGGTAPRKNCVVKPSACGYPDETNTGYKHTGVTLTTSGITINVDGDFIIDQDNTVIDSKRIDGCVVIRAKNVTIKRSLITGCQAFYNIWLQEAPGGGIRDTSNFLMEDVEVDGNRYFTNAALVDDNGKGLVVRRMDMHDVADGPHPGENWLIEDSYIHDMYVCPNDCHTDSIQSAGAQNVTIRHNTILNNPDNNGTGGKNAVVRIATEQDPVDNFVVDNNLLDGGNYAVQVRSQGNGAPTNVRVTSNRIVPTWRFAPYDFTGIPVYLSGNFRDDTLEALDTPM